MMMNLLPRSLRAATAGALASLALLSTSAFALFEDNEARRALLDLRQRVEQQRAAQAEELRRLQEENAQLRRSLLELQRQIEAMGGEVARLRGQDESMARDLAVVQKRQQDIATGVDERLRKFEPSQVNVDGREFVAEPTEQQAFEAALATFRRGDFVAAQAAFADFLKRFPQSGYKPTALFWLGNAQYANRDYRGAIGNFRALLAQAPDHPRAPEAVLSIANCQIELKDNASARRTLDDLVKAYPQSEAASAARERLARLR
jgi:tol-pal system protein YbgF